jgi:hypothetical protein
MANRQGLTNGPHMPSLPNLEAAAGGGRRALNPRALGDPLGKRLPLASTHPLIENLNNTNDACILRRERYLSLNIAC